jgi:hypothetical protein
MQPHRRRSKTPSHLSQATQRRLTSYALAAAAAGVGTLALVTPSEAEIVYTPTNVKIPLRVYQWGFGYKLDLNGDGIADFELMNSTFAHGGNAFVAPVVHGNKVVGFGSYASALVPGVSVGSGGPFAHRAHGTFMARWNDSSGYVSSRGPWKNSRNRYLGLKFLVNGETHFGWARLSISFNIMVLTGYAYETIANKAIVAGQTSGSDQAGRVNPADPAPPLTSATLGRLAQGAAGLFAWRRDPV